jgi:hypothetical protein
MPRYTLTLTWTLKGANPGHPISVAERRNKAIALAHAQRPPVDVISIVPGPHNPENIAELAATWIVEGTAASVRNMISTWRGNNVTVVAVPPP